MVGVFIGPVHKPFLPTPISLHQVVDESPLRRTAFKVVVVYKKDVYSDFVWSFSIGRYKIVFTLKQISLNQKGEFTRPTLFKICS